MMPMKMPTWLARRNDAKAIAKIRPKYLARSATSILSATKFMATSLHHPRREWFRSIDDWADQNRHKQRSTPKRCSTKSQKNFALLNAVHAHSPSQDLNSS